MIGILQQGLDALALPVGMGPRLLDVTCPLGDLRLQGLFLAQEPPVTLRQHAHLPLRPSQQRVGQDHRGRESRNQGGDQPGAGLVDRQVAAGELGILLGDEVFQRGTDLSHQPGTHARFGQRLRFLGALGRHQLDRAVHLRHLAGDVAGNARHPGALARIIGRHLEQGRHPAVETGDGLAIGR